MQIIAIIPARGGSKGIPRKNLVEINGLSLVAHSINHGLQASMVNRVLVSTDDEEIRNVALAHGAEAPFLRPAELAQDHTLDLPVFEHVLKFLEDEEGYHPDLVVHLRPTAPLRLPKWIDQAVQLLINHPEADSVRSVSPPDKHPYRIFRIDANGYLEPVMKHEHPLPYLLRRQDLPPMYYYNCVIDVTRPHTILEKRSMTGDRMLPFMMDADDSFDIDAPRDLEIVRLFAGRFK
jgi:N-acylneuraminate cytidylyltransferase